MLESQPIIALWQGVSNSSLTQGVMSDAERRLRMLLVDSLGAQWYVFDPESTDILLVSSEVAAVLRAIQSGENLPEDLLEALIEHLHLDQVEAASESHEYNQWGLTLHLNHACNLACEYCYADGRTSDSDGVAKGAYGGKILSMSAQVLERCLETFMSSAPTNNITVGFLGGEPLLVEQRFLDAVLLAEEKAKKYGRQVRFELTTNGTLLTDAVLHCFTKHDFSIVVSMDGNRETHDRQRPLANGEGSYEQVQKAVERLSQLQVRLGVRMTAIRGRPGIIQAHSELARTPACAVGFQFHMYGSNAMLPLVGDEREALFNHSLDIARRILAGDQDAAKLVTIRDILTGIVMKGKKQYHCAAGRWASTVTPNGDVFPCHRFVGMSKFKLGNVMDEGFQFTSHAMFEHNTVKNRVLRRNGTQNCALCYAHHVCGGGCAQIAAANTGRIDELPPFYCQETRLRTQAVVRALLEKLHPQLAPPSIN